MFKELDTDTQRKPTKPLLRVADVVGQCFFVGMNNKPGMKPLDSKTMSGKMIDLIINELPFKCTKTNLCEVEYMPKDTLEINKSGVEWHRKYEPEDCDVIVLLGNWVHKNFWYDRFNVIKIAHPASMFGHVNKEQYVQNAASKIKAAIQ